jgi:hypothetical protein
VPWRSTDESGDASSLTRGPDDVFGTHRRQNLVGIAAGSGKEFIPAPGTGSALDAKHVSTR